ncbi:MAG: cytochrome c oxidase subunit 4 [Microbacteriaceae bacterium]
MRANYFMFMAIAAFFVVADAAYIIWSIADRNFFESNYNSVEWVGAIALGLCAILSGFIAFYVGRTYKSQGGELPEDRVDANIDDGDAEQGFFAPWSWWPVMLAASAALVFLGLAVGVWVAFIGGAVGVISLVGWQYEFYRGYHAH